MAHIETKGLKKNLDGMDEQTLRQTIIDLCEDNPKLRQRVVELEERASSPIKIRSESPTKNEEKKKTFDVQRVTPKKAIRVRVYKNGGLGDPTIVVAKTLDQLLRAACDQLQLPLRSTSRLYTENGKRVSTLDGLATDQVLYVSGGEAWADPSAPAKPTAAAPNAPDPRLLPTTAVTVRAYINGGFGEGVTAVARGLNKESQWDNLLDDCTYRLEMNKAASRLFSKDGKELKKMDDLERGQVVYVSSGEPWRGEDGKIKGKIRPLKDSHLFAVAAISIYVVVNGHRPMRNPSSKEPPGTMVVGNSMEKLCENATERLALPSPVRKFYTEAGKLVEKFEDFEKGQLYYAATTGGFKNPDDPFAGQVSPLSSDHRLVRPPMVRVWAMANGERATRNRVLVVITTKEEVLHEATRKLDLSTPAKKLFDDEGNAIADLSKLKNEQTIYVSCGEPFKPLTGAQVPTSAIKPIAADHGLLTPGSLRLNAEKNGYSSHRKIVVGKNMEELLACATERLCLPYPARKLFDEQGRALAWGDLTKDMLVIVSSGEAFRPKKVKGKAGTEPA